ncbi:MAG: adenylate/guanylate cyclase domain-containing protein [Solirubrobacterales bacterium]
MGTVACPSCGTENPERARFCMSCGAGLSASCPHCGAEAPPGARFCIECGGALSAPGAGERPAAGPDGAAAGGEGAAESPPEERRHVSVLFADLSGYTSVAERMDPEAVKSMLDHSLRRLSECVTGFGGSVDKFIGDNVMAVFGAPVAHEDDPERAVRAGLAMQAEMEEINASIPGDVSFSLRVGINTGEVLAGEMGNRYTVIGDTVNVAARLQAAARPGSVTVGEATQRASREAIAYTQLEALTLKGKSEPVPAWEATGILAGPGASRAAGRSAPLIGRDEESELLLSLCDRVQREGRPHLVTLVGPAGVGKTRLLRELTERAAHLPEPPLLELGECPPYGSGRSYWALAEVLRVQFEIAADEPAESAWEKLRTGVVALVGEEDPDEVERLITPVAVVLGLEAAEEQAGSEAEDPQRMRETLFSAIRGLIERTCALAPLLLAIDDIHWADEGMLDLIEHLARSVRGPLLIVCLARDELLERRPGWGGGRRNATTIALEPLSESETEELVDTLYAGNGGDSALVARVAARAGGNPLFAEEMVNRLQEPGADPEALPESVHSVLAARLDSLPPFERRLLQYASVVGQTFWDGVLLRASGARERDLETTLASLEQKDLVMGGISSRLAGQREYAFKHALIRDVAYGMLPKVTRCRQHFVVGELIEERAGESGETAVALVAEHYGRAARLGAEAGLEADELRQFSVPAARFAEAAGDAAAALYSNREALDHYRSALGHGDVLDPEVRARVGEKVGDAALRLGRVDEAIEVWKGCLEHQRAQENLARVGDLHCKIGAAHWDRGDREASIENYQRGIDLLKDGPPCIELVRLYEEAASLYMHTGDNMLAIYASEKALRLAERLGEAAAASRAHGIFGRVFGRIGDFEKARENLERSVELARGSDKREAVRALLTLGYHLEAAEADFEGAGSAYAEALELATEVGDLPSQIDAHAALAQVALYAADWDAVERETEASAGLAEREGLTGKLCSPYVMRGALRWREGEWQAAEDLLREAGEIAEQVGRSEVAFWALRWLASVQRDRGDLADADLTLSRALDICERAGMVSQSLDAMAERAICLALAGKEAQASELAEEVAQLSERLHYPAPTASAREAAGMADPDPARGAETLAEALEAWDGLELPLEAARTGLLRAGRLAAAGVDGAPAAAEEAARRFEELGVGHLAVQARALAGSRGA